jgi:DNA-binding NtrC family response regulator
MRPRQASSSGPKILVAEDDDAVRQMLRESLERDGFEVVAVASAQEALARIAKENFDASLSGLHMPQTRDGLNIVSAMRHIQPHAVTLVLSTYATPFEALLTAHIQADGVIEKPVQVASLRWILREKLAQSEGHRHQAEQEFASSTGPLQREASLDRRIGAHSRLGRLVN